VVRPPCSGSVHHPRRSDRQYHSHTTHSSGALPASPSSSAEFGRLPGDAHDFSYAQHGTLDSTHSTRGPSIYDHSRTTYGFGALPVSPSGCAGATVTVSTSAVNPREGCTSGSSGQSSSDDHVSEAGLPADRLTLSATSASIVSTVPSSVHTALIDPN
jgi:hypothetical protein